MSEISTIQKSRWWRWQQMVDEYTKSGKSVTAFCRERHIPTSTFGYWVRKFSDSHNSKGMDRLNSSSFMPVIIKTAVPSKSPQIILPNGVKIDLGDELSSGTVSKFIQEVCGVKFQQQKELHERP